MTAIVLGVAVGAVYGLVAAGIVLVYKSSRVLNFAQAEFGTFALYIASTMTNAGRPWGVAAAAAIAATTVLALAFERIVVRPMGKTSTVSLSVATAGLLFLLFAVEIKLWGIAPRLVRGPIAGRGVELFGFILSPMHIAAIVALGLLAAGLWVLVARTRLGLGLLAVAEDADTARLMGVPHGRITAFTWGLAGALGAVAGLLIGPVQGVFGPLSLTTSAFTAGLAAALLGGLTSLPGAFVGGIAVGIIETLLKLNLSRITGVGSFGVLGVILVVLLVRPQGLFGRQA